MPPANQEIKCSNMVIIAGGNRTVYVDDRRDALKIEATIIGELVAPRLGPIGGWR